MSAFLLKGLIKVGRFHSLFFSIHTMYYSHYVQSCNIFNIGLVCQVTNSRTMLVVATPFKTYIDFFFVGNFRFVYRMDTWLQDK